MLNENNLVKDSKNLAVTAGEAFYAAGINFSQGSALSRSILQISAASAGVLTLSLDGVDTTLNGGAALTAGSLYEFEISVVRGKTYNLKYSASCTVQLYWMRGDAI